jgi:ssDNA-binding Zn-finger/Zn-ribbon topoisomerase 1
MSVEPNVPSVMRSYRMLLRHPCRRRDQDGINVPCPKCNAPMALRLGSHGPYFHCNCVRR